MQNQTKSVLGCLLFCLTFLSSCQTPTAREISKYVGRPQLNPPCISNGDGTCFFNGEILDTTNMLCSPSSDFDKIQTHLERMEFLRYRCKKYGRCR